MAIFSRNRPDRPELPNGHKDDASPWYVAPDLRDDYLAHSPTFHEIKTEVGRLIEIRADEARKDWLAKRSAAPHQKLAPTVANVPGVTHLPGEPSPAEQARKDAKRAYEKAVEEGEQKGDAELAEHRARLTFAKRCKAERDKAEQAEKRRQDARCRSCNTLDVPTAPAVLTLVPASDRNKARTYRVGDGPVCAHCRVVALEDEKARIAAQKVDGVTRAELVRRFIERGR